MPVFQPLRVSQGKPTRREGLKRLTLTNAPVTRAHVWTALRRPAAVRRRERDHPIVRRMDGHNGLEVAPWLDRDEAPLRAWGPACHEAGLRGWERAPLTGRPHDHVSPEWGPGACAQCLRYR